MRRSKPLAQGPREPLEPATAGLVALDGGLDPAAGPGSCLVMLHGPASGRSWALDRPELWIGRDESCDIVVAIDTVSRRHCLVSAGRDGIAVRDLASTNGSFVNDEPLRVGTDRPLRPGDHVRVGAAIFRLLQGDDLEALQREEVHRSRIVDGLTQVGNRRHLLDALERELARHQRYGRPLALLLFDVDGFRRINDDWGRLTGDGVLRELAARVQAGVRRCDVLARWGDDAFALALPESDGEAARACAERLRRLVAEHAFLAHGDRLPVGISLGIACAGADGLTAAALVAEAEARPGT